MRATPCACTRCHRGRRASCPERAVPQVEITERSLPRANSPLAVRGFGHNLGSDVRARAMEPESQPLRRPVSPGVRALGGGVIGIVSVGAGALLAAELGAPLSGAVCGAGLGVAAAAGLLFVARRFLSREETTDPSAHKRPLHQLSEELTSFASPSDVAVAIERTIPRLVPFHTIDFSFASAASAGSYPARQGSDRSGEHEIITLPKGQGQAHALA